MLANFVFKVKHGDLAACYGVKIYTLCGRASFGGNASPSFNQLPPITREHAKLIAHQLRYSCLRIADARLVTQYAKASVQARVLKRSTPVSVIDKGHGCLCSYLPSLFLPKGQRPPDPSLGRTCGGEPIAGVCSVLCFFSVWDFVLGVHRPCAGVTFH